MSTVTGNSAAYHASVEAPDDGDERDAGGLLVVAEAAMDNTAFLYARVTGGSEGINTGYINASGNVDIGGSAHVDGSLTVDGLHTAANVNTGTLQASVLVDAQNIASDTNVTAGGGFFVGERTVTVVVDSTPETDDGWELDRSSLDFFRVSTSTSTRHLRIPLNPFLKNGDNITGATARYKGAPAHSNLPGALPELWLYAKRIGTVGTASGSIDSQADESVDVTAFQLEHPITLVLGVSHTVNLTTHAYYLVMSSEGGSDALAGAEYHGATITYKYTRVERN